MLRTVLLSLFIAMTFIHVPTDKVDLQCSIRCQKSCENDPDQAACLKRCRSECLDTRPASQ